MLVVMACWILLCSACIPRVFAQQPVEIHSPPPIYNTWSPDNWAYVNDLNESAQADDDSVRLQ